MSMPSFPVDAQPIGRDEALNQILASIALEELSLSHILNASGEGLQHILGTLPGQSVSNATPEEIIAANESVRDILEMAARNQQLLQQKMETALCGCPCGYGCGCDCDCCACCGEAHAPVTASSAFAANTSGTVLVVVADGVSIPLPNSQLLSSDITVNAENTVFTVHTAGRYRISYQVNITTALAASTRLLVNGAGNTASTVASVVPISHYNNEVLVDLPADSTVSLQMFGPAATAVLVPGALGAALTLVRLS